MDSLPPDILIRILDKSRLSDQLISHRLINNKFRPFIPTAASRIQRVNTMDLVIMSRKLGLFSGHEDSVRHHVQNHLHEDPEIKRAFASLLLYVCSLYGLALNCISFATPIILDTATAEKLASICPHIIEISVGYKEVRYPYTDVMIFNDILQALPSFQGLKILRIISACDTSFLQPVVAQLHLQKLRTSGHEAPILTGDPKLLDELVVEGHLTVPYQEIRERLCEVFPNLRRHYNISKRTHAQYFIERPGRAEENYRRLRMLRGSGYIGGYNMWLIDQRLFLDFPYLQNLNVRIADEEGCYRVIRAVQSSGNWKEIRVTISNNISTEKCLQLFHTLFYTTAVRLKTLHVWFEYSRFSYSVEQFLLVDLAGSKVVFDKTLRQCDMHGPGVLPFAAKIACDCNGLKRLNITNCAWYGGTQPESGLLEELLQTALDRFEQANLQNLLWLSVNIDHSPAVTYQLLQRLRACRLHTVHLQFDKYDDKMSELNCSSLLREDTFPHLRNIKLGLYNEGTFYDTMLNILRNMPALERLEIQLLTWRPPEDYWTPVVPELGPPVWQHIVEHANLQFCSVKPSYDINYYFSEGSFASWCNAVTTREKVDKNGRILPWLYVEFKRWYKYNERKPDQHHMGQNAYCFVEAEEDERPSIL